MSAAPELERIGEIVGGKYRVVRFLAAGGMGAVYEAHHTLVKRRFAIKFLRRDLALQRESLTRFSREAQAAGALESENVTAAMDFGVTADGAPYILMEYLIGESLEALSERAGPLPLERATDLVMQACQGMQIAHAAGIVHRDLKPQNLFVCRRADGTDLLKILDFGIAKLEVSPDDTSATRTGTILGTPAYMSPEQARGEATIDQRSDVYALAAILYELVSGKKPHPGDAPALLYHIATQKAVPLDSVAPDLPEPFFELMDRALSKDPATRPSSAEELGRELSAYARRTVWPDDKAQEDSSSSLPPKLDQDPGLPALAGAQPPARRPTVFFALGAIGLLVIVALALSRGGEQPSPAALPPPAPERETPLGAAPLEPAPSAAPGASDPAEPPAEEAAAEPSGRPPGRPRGRPPTSPLEAERSSVAHPPPTPSGARVSFDAQNPYD